jgi:hypothetical protein
MSTMQSKERNRTTQSTSSQNWTSNGNSAASARSQSTSVNDWARLTHVAAADHCVHSSLSTIDARRA